MELPRLKILKNFARFLKKINPFVPNAPFLYPLKTSENLTDWEHWENVHWERMGLEQ